MEDYLLWVYFTWHSARNSKKKIDIFQFRNKIPKLKIKNCHYEQNGPYIFLVKKWNLWEATVCVCVCACMCTHTQLCLTLCNPMDYSPPGSSVHGVFQARILECIVISFSRGSFWPRDQTHVSCLTGRFFITEPLWCTLDLCISSHPCINMYFVPENVNHYWIFHNDAHSEVFRVEVY